MMDQVYRWLLARELPGRRTPAGQESRARFCASMEGNAIWYSIRLGLDDERTAQLAQRLVRWQWPDGGWNCDDRATAAIVVVPGDGHSAARHCGRSVSVTETPLPSKRWRARRSCS